MLRNNNSTPQLKVFVYDNFGSDDLIQLSSHFFVIIKFVYERNDDIIFVQAQIFGITTTTDIGVFTLYLNTKKN